VNDLVRPRRTKIVATLGPATDSRAIIGAMLRAGVDLVRINFSHGSHEEHRHRLEMLREEAAAQKRVIGVLGDLQGPKIRTQRFRDGAVQLEDGQRFALDVNLGVDEGDATRVGVTYKALPEDVHPEDVLVLDDGRIVLRVEDIADDVIGCTVVSGGRLSNNKGINRRGGGLSAKALTEKDRGDIRFAAEQDIDYLAVSFPRSAEEIHEARELLREAGSEAGLIAKIERAEARRAIDQILRASDAIMIARGDLGVEIGDEELPAAQKDLIKRARAYNRVVITATQMMQSMIENPIPTRAEVFDVANAVLDGTDAVMLSGETATGRYPVKVVEAMSRICRNAEKQRRVTRSTHRIDSRFERVDEAIAMATMYTANHLHVRAIAALTESGSTARWMSRISSGIPIYALTRHERTGRKVTLYRGVYPVAMDTLHTEIREANRAAVQVLVDSGVVKEDDLVIITKGDLGGVGGGTNSIKILRVGDPILSTS
jgi:pyruvate kinase